MDNDLKERFDAADGQMQFGEGSLESVHARADQRTRRTQMVSGAAALLLVVVVGLFTFQLVAQSNEPDIIDVTNEETEVDGAEVELSSGPLDADDFVYVGSFTTPADDEFGFGGDAIAFNAANNSLFITGYRINPEVAEISIPELSPHEGQRNGLVEGDLLQGFADITNGLASAQIGSEALGGQDIFTINGLEVVSSDDGRRLVWTATQFQNAAASELPGHGHSSLDLANPDVQGPWRLDGFIAEQTAGYVFDVPDSYADTFLGGRNMMAGYLVEVRGFTSQGAPFFAFDGPGSSESDAIELANYNFAEHEVSDFSTTMSATGADWVTTSDGRSAILTLGNSLTLDPTENCAFGNEADVAAHAPQLRLYDPADLAAVAAGTSAPFEVEPYLVVSLEEHVIPVCGAQVSGLAFDAATNRLFVVQSDVTATEQGFDARPVIHVFSLG